jgi:tRNA (guanine-N7-)-methyltransferase
VGTARPRRQAQGGVLRADPHAAEAPRQRLLYGRRRGRKLRSSQRDLLATLLPQFRFALPAEGQLEPRQLFVSPVEAVWVELGFGAGEHLAAQAAATPNRGVIGCEVFENGVVKILAEAKRRGLTNLRLFIDDARLLVEALADASVERVFILFPDPWPKQRHHKRRLVSTALLDVLSRILADGGELRLATDDMPYLRTMLEETTGHRDFEWLARHPQDWRERPADWPATRYEQKALAAGRRPAFLRFRRRPRGAAADRL